MRAKVHAGATIVAVGLAAAACGSTSQAPGPLSVSRSADLVIRAARLVRRPGDVLAQGGVAIADGRVLAADYSARLEEHIGQTTRVIDIPGGTIMPGLCDAHGHLVGLGESLESLNLVGTRSVGEVLERVRALAERLAPGQWLVGRGWDQNDWPPAERSFPDRGPLDSVVGDRPVALYRVDGHALWASSTALATAGVNAASTDPTDGRVVRRPDGTPSGVLIDGAMASVERRIPAPDVETIRRRAIAAARVLAQKGISALHDMGEPVAVARVLAEMSLQGELPIRLHVYLDGSDSAAALAVSEGIRHTGLMTLIGVKYFLDGALGSRGAALLAPYSDEPGHAGTLVMSADDLGDRAAKAMRHGMQVAVHAIGDRANRTAIDVLGTLRQKMPTAPAPRIEHAQILDASDLGRIGEAALVASMQPVHCTSDMPWAPDRLGAERLRGAYAWRSIRGAGAILAFGSDCPVESPDPLQGLYVATTRRSPTEPRGPAYPPQNEALGLDAALEAFTLGPARAVGEGDRRGALLAGQDADVTVLENDPLAPGRPAEELLQTRVAYTIVAGRVVYGD